MDQWGIPPVRDPSGAINVITNQDYSEKGIGMRSTPRLFFGLALIVAGLLFIFSDRLSHIGPLIAGLMLWAGAVLFAILYLEDDLKWWAMIPAGLLLTIGTLIILSAFDLAGVHLRNVIFMAGLALTFFYLWGHRNPENKLGWTIYPAAAAGLMALLTFFDRTRWLDGATLLAAGIILVGGWLLVRALRA